jgi:hypothetical protein
MSRTAPPARPGQHGGSEAYVSETARDAVRSSATGILSLGLEVVVGVWLLFLFTLALAWDPLDRRFGFHDRRRQTRPSGPVAPPAGAYGFGGPVDGAADADEDGAA